MIINKLLDDNLERLDARFPDKELLSVSEASEYLGVERRYVKKKYFGDKRYISKVLLANALS